MEMAKTVKKYGNIYRKIIDAGSCYDSDRKQEAYEKRLTEIPIKRDLRRNTRCTN